MPSTRSKGWWYPWIFVAGMLVVILVNGVLVYFALGTWTGIETEDHYRKGLAYNQALAAARIQDERGWQVSMAFDPAPTNAEEHRGRLTITMSDRDGLPLDGLTVTVSLIRPTHEGYDFNLTLKQTGRGIYSSSIAVPLPGQWDAKVHATRRDEVFLAEYRLHFL